MGHYIVLNENNIISGFGRNDYGQVSSVSGNYLTGIKQIEGGGYHTIILFENGRVSGFGRDDRGQASLGNNLTGVTKIAAGLFHNLAILNNGRVTGWGQSTTIKPSPSNYDKLEDISKAGYTNNLTGVIDIAAGYESSYALYKTGANIYNFTGWGIGKWIYDNNFDTIQYPINFGPLRKISAGYNFCSLLLDDTDELGVSIRHYAQPSPNPQFSEIFSSDFDPSFRGSVIAYSGYILNDLIASGGTNLTGIKDISAGTDYTIAKVGTGLITGWGYEGYQQINFYNKVNLTQPRVPVIYTGTPVPVPPPTGNVCFNPKLYNSNARVFFSNSGSSEIISLKAGLNISAALNSGSGLSIIGDEKEFLYTTDFQLGFEYLGNTNEIYLNRFPTGDYTNPPLIPVFGILKLSGFGITGINKNFKRDTTGYYGAFNQSGTQDTGNHLYTCYFNNNDSWVIRRREDELTSLDHINSITLTGSYFNDVNTTYTRPDNNYDINFTSASQNQQINWDNNSGYWRLSTTGIVPNYIKKITLYYNPNSYISLGDQSNNDYYISMSSENVYDYQFFIYQDYYGADLVWALHDGDGDFYNINGDLSNTNWTGVNGNNNMTGSTGSFISNYSPGFVYKTSGNFQLTGNIIWQKDEYGVDPVPVTSARGTGSFSVYDLYINNSNPLLLNSGTWETIYPKAINTTYRNVPYDPTLATGYSMNKPDSIFKFDAFSAKLIKYTGNPTGILNNWPYGTEAQPITGSGIYPSSLGAFPFEPSFFEYLFIEDKQQYPKAIVFANPQEGVIRYQFPDGEGGGYGTQQTGAFLSGLQITGNTNVVVNEKRVIFGFLKTGSNPSLGINNFYFSPQSTSRSFETSTTSNSLYHKIPATSNNGNLKWKLISGGSTGNGNYGEANEDISPVIFSRYLSEYELKNYIILDNLPFPLTVAEILGSQFFESDRIQLTFGLSDQTTQYNIYRKIKDSIEDYSFFTSTGDSYDSSYGNQIHNLIDYSPEYGNPPFGTDLQYKIYPVNSLGSGIPTYLEARLVTRDC